MPTFASADRALSVTHHDELLGALTIIKPRGEAVSPTDDKLPADVAAQAGLVLRNVRLTAELLGHVEELRPHARAWSARKTTSAAAWNATSTMEPSSSWSPSR